jgi:hypothetical protein
VSYFGRPCSAASYSICAILIVLVQYWMCTQYYPILSNIFSSASVYITSLLSWRTCSTRRHWRACRLASCT